MMVGLSVVLEAQKTPQVINKTTIMLSNNNNKLSHSSAVSSQNSPFLEQCFLCKKRLLPGKDIYMYKGDRAFCSVDCRCKQIFMEEEEAIQKANCSIAAMKPSRSKKPSWGF